MSPFLFASACSLSDLASASARSCWRFLISASLAAMLRTALGSAGAMPGLTLSALALAGG
jgi:hypothetical protein